jgi:hypothetical protein
MGTWPLVPPPYAYPRLPLWVCREVSHMYLHTPVGGREGADKRSAMMTRMTL